MGEYNSLGNRTQICFIDNKYLKRKTLSDVVAGLINNNPYFSKIVCDEIASLPRYNIKDVNFSCLAKFSEQELTVSKVTCMLIFSLFLVIFNKIDQLTRAYGGLG